MPYFHIPISLIHFFVALLFSKLLQLLLLVLLKSLPLLLIFLQLYTSLSPIACASFPSTKTFINATLPTPTTNNITHDSASTYSKHLLSLQCRVIQKLLHYTETKFYIDMPTCQTASPLD